jgi:large subunit ribosomal protein L21
LLNSREKPTIPLLFPVAFASDKNGGDRKHAMYAVIKTGGKQYRVSEGDTLRVEKLAVEAGESIDFEEVLALGEGENLTIGTPFVSGGIVSARVTGHGRGEKIKIVKFKRRKNYLRQNGHRQDFTELSITKIAPGT